MTPITFRIRYFLLFIAGLLCLIQCPLNVWGAEWTINSFLDEADLDQEDGVCQSSSGACTLRAAIQEANMSSDDTLITLADGIYFLDLQPSYWEKIQYGEDAGGSSSNDLDFAGPYDSTITIRGVGQEQTIINAKGVNAAFEVHSGHVVLEDLSIVEGVGRSMNFGKMVINRCRISDHTHGALHNGGELTIVASTITNNASTTYGGAITNIKKLSIIESAISNNTAPDWGGGIYHGSPTYIPGEVTYAIELSIKDSRISGNSAGIGGGIFIERALPENGDSAIHVTAEIESSEITDNAANSVGGGICVDGASTEIDTGAIKIVAGKTQLSVKQSIIRGNSAGHGGGISIGTYWRVAADVSIDRSAIVENSGKYEGGGIFNEGTLTLVNSTVSGNTVPDGIGVGSGVSNFGTATIFGSTIAYNASAKHGAGLAHSGDSLAIGHTIIALNAAIEKPADCMDWESGVGESLGYNVISATTSCHFFTRDSDIVGPIESPVETFLLPLVDLGGAALVHPLGAGSPAINKGDPSACSVTDQIEQTRIGRCDIGAFESSCGNGVMDMNELCDDGNEVDDDECTRACAIPKQDELSELEAVSGEATDGTADASEATVEPPGVAGSGGCSLVARDVHKENLKARLRSIDDERGLPFYTADASNDEDGFI